MTNTEGNIKGIKTRKANKRGLEL